MLQKHRAYFSHAIRGKLGVAATPESMAANNRLAHKAAVLMRCILPEIRFYVPGEVDEVISLLYQDGRLTERDILWADCQIIERTCDILLAWSPDNFISTGMQIEIDFAHRRNIPVYIIHDVEQLQTWKPEILKYLETK